MNDIAEEIAGKLWERAWDTERDEGVRIIVAALRVYAGAEVAVERERCAKIAEDSAWPGIPTALSHHGKRIATLIRGPIAKD